MAFWRGLRRPFSVVAQKVRILREYRMGQPFRLAGGGHGCS
jgi:hypothetical protein